MSNVKEVTTETFEKEVLSSDVPVLVDFGLNGVVHASNWLQE